MEIRILGPACINCLKLDLLVAQALKEMGHEAAIVKVVEEKEISRFREVPPILLVGGKIVHAGLPLPAVEEIKTFISQLW